LLFDHSVKDTCVTNITGIESVNAGAHFLFLLLSYTRSKASHAIGNCNIRHIHDDPEGHPHVAGEFVVDTQVYPF
jgi:hypothetical protein